MSDVNEVAQKEMPTSVSLEGRRAFITITLDHEGSCKVVTHGNMFEYGAMLAAASNGKQLKEAIIKTSQGLSIGLPSNELASVMLSIADGDDEDETESQAEPQGEPQSEPQQEHQPESTAPPAQETEAA